MIKENSTLQSLNIESNFITAQGMMAIIKALAENSTLYEIKIDNQVNNWAGFDWNHCCDNALCGCNFMLICNAILITTESTHSWLCCFNVLILVVLIQRQKLGDSVEMEIASMLEKNPSILKIGYHFTQQGPRARAAQAITRNNDYCKFRRTSPIIHYMDKGLG